MSMFDLILEHVRTSVPFAGLVGVDVQTVDDGTATARLEERPAVHNHIGTLHAGALFTLGEAASGAAMAGAFAPVLLSVRPVAADARIVYRRPARGTVTAAADVVGEPADLLAELERVGKVRFRVDVRMEDERQREVATMEVDWHVSRAS
jgi:uncharacterized protein (TIGR00369 family)